MRSHRLACLARVARLHARSRRLPVALAAILACAAAFRLLLHGHWDDYGALQLPLIVETACAMVIAAATGSPFGDPERGAGPLLPALRLGATLALTGLAAAALVCAAVGLDLAGGYPELLRNVVGLTGLGLLCAVVLGGGLSWTCPAIYLVVATYQLYETGTGGGSAMPWLWPARPPHDLVAGMCACGTFVAGLLLITVRGARDTGERAR